MVPPVILHYRLVLSIFHPNFYLSLESIFYTSPASHRHHNSQFYVSFRFEKDLHQYFFRIRKSSDIDYTANLDYTSGKMEGELRHLLCRKLHSIRWSVSHIVVVSSYFICSILVDSVAQEVEIQKSTSYMVFLYGGVGPLPSDVSIAGVAKALNVCLVCHVYSGKSIFSGILLHLLRQISQK
ncbi:unnamed protein product [Lactuca saligna]|uniref:Uncharacterized protein n=1 Tax=Lactuca saligna TaxID=75948 RepID=A0AA35YV01_LACSI|nr:unnamed protein product [Lactuca saligna]